MQSVQSTERHRPKREVLPEFRIVSLCSAPFSMADIVQVWCRIASWTLPAGIEVPVKLLLRLLAPFNASSPTNLSNSFATMVCSLPSQPREGDAPMDAAGLHKRIDRFKELIDGL